MVSMVYNRSIRLQMPSISTRGSISRSMLNESNDSAKHTDVAIVRIMNPQPSSSVLSALNNQTPFAILPNLPVNCKNPDFILNPRKPNEILIIDPEKDSNNFIFDTKSSKYFHIFNDQVYRARTLEQYRKTVNNHTLCSLSDSSSDLYHTNNIGAFSSIWHQPRGQAACCYRVFNTSYYQWQKRSIQFISFNNDYPLIHGTCFRHGDWILTISFLQRNQINIFKLSPKQNKLLFVTSVTLDSQFNLSHSQILALPNSIRKLVKMKPKKYWNFQDGSSMSNQTDDDVTLFVVFGGSGQAFAKSFLLFEINFTVLNLIAIATNDGHNNKHGCIVSTEFFSIISETSYFTQTIDGSLQSILDPLDERYFQFSWNFIENRYLLFFGGLIRNPCSFDSIDIRISTNQNNNNYSPFDRQISNIFYFDLILRCWRVLKYQLPFPIAGHKSLVIHKNENKNDLDLHILGGKSLIMNSTSIGNDCGCKKYIAT